MDRQIDITWGSLWRIVLMIILAVLVYSSRHVLAILFLAIVISSALDAPLNFLERKKIPRIIGMIFIVISTLAIITVLLYTIIPIVVIELKDVAANFGKVNTSLGQMVGIPRLAQNLDLKLEDIASPLFAGDFSVVNFLPKFFENVIMGITVVVISFYLALYRDGIEGFFKVVLPLAYENYAISVFHRTRKRIGKWLEAQIFLSLIVGITTFIGLKILGVDYALVLGFLAGFFEIIPFIGPVIAGALAFLVAITQSSALGIYTLILFTGIHQLEAHIVVPLVMRKTTGIHPVIVALSILAGWQIYGIIGVILAIPFMVVVDELIDDFSAKKYRQQTL